MTMHPIWRDLLQREFTQHYFKDLVNFIREERKVAAVFPSGADTFNALAISPDEVRVVILGQDPYHNAGQAHGLSFSVLPGVKVPPSLRNIYAELETDVPGFKRPSHGCLQAWQDQGILLLNAVLTVRAHEPGSHRERGWERFTDAILRLLNARSHHLVFILWGRYARAKKALLDTDKHTVIESAHPSPMSAPNGFFGSRPFSRCNEALEKAGRRPVDWTLPEEP